MRIYALLVGINDYAPSVGKLQGSVNDAKAYRDFLESNFKGQLELECLLDADATRANIISGFRNLLCRAGKDDVALFQYAGHGARWKAANEFDQFYPDGFDEGMICYDSRRTPEAWDMADKELAILLSEVAKKEPHIAVILDCCHSGSGTRSADKVTQLTARNSHTIKRPRPLKSYLGEYYQKKFKAGEALVPPSSRHILMSAADRYSAAFESKDEHRGVFSKTLISAIDKVGLDVSYADLFLRVRSLVRHNAHGQTPQFEAYEGFNSWNGFLNRLALTRSRRFNIQFDGNDMRFVVDCGALHGLPTQIDECPEFQLFADQESDKVIGHATAPSVGLNASVVKGKDFELDWQKSYAAELTSIPKPQLDVFVHGDNQTAIDALVETSGKVISVFTWDQESSTGLKYAVKAEEDGFSVHYLQSDKLIQKVLGSSRGSCEHVIGVLNRIAKWEHALQLQNSSPTVDRSVVEFVVKEAKGQEVASPDDEITFDVTGPPNEKSSMVTLSFFARNKTKQRLHLMLVWFDEQFRVQVFYNNPHDEGKNQFQMQLDAGAHGIHPQMPLALDPEEGNQATHTFKLFVSSDKIDNFMIAQDPLKFYGKEVRPGPTGSRGVHWDSNVEKVTWFASTIKVNLNRESAKVGASESTLADGQIRIKPHPALTGGASLLPAAPVSRGARSDGFAIGLAKHGFDLLNFSRARGSDQSVLEINNVENRDSVSADQPLQLELDVPLKEDERIVPMAFDGQHLMLAGDTWKDESGKTLVQIDKVPQTEPAGRSVLSAFKLYFFKAVCGLKNFNRLAAFDITGDGRVNRSTSGLGEKVHAAEKILVMVHGMYGDSYTMAKEIRNLVAVDKKVASSFGSFDLILGFDYETISTPFEKSAAELKNLLKTKGIDESKGKQVTIIADSIGGLVARWMIEREGGNQFVDHLVMCGTPNEGSPFGTVALAANAINNLANMAINMIPGFAKSFIQAAQQTLEQRSLTTTLAQMATNSDFLQQLNASPDPAVRYTIIAGNIDDYIANAADKDLDSLLTKIGASDKFRKLFGGAPHDVAVSVDSMRAVMDSRSPQPEKNNLSCHHLNCLLSDQGIECLRNIDWNTSGKGAVSE